jgi:hypothetical protein
LDKLEAGAGCRLANSAANIRLPPLKEASRRTWETR